MTTCSTNVCGTGNWTGPLPGDPDNNSVLTASPAFGGIDVTWTYPAVNPEAVAYVKLFRGLSVDFSTAYQIAVVSGDTYYDKMDVQRQYFYWIQFVSVNGTVGALIGPATATAKPLIHDVLVMLAGQIDSGVLAQALRADIDKISLHYQELLAEVDARIAANNAYSTAMAQVQSGLVQALTLVNTEITQRQDGDSALVTQLNTYAALTNQANAAIITETSARVAGDTANAALITTLNSQVNDATTGLPATRATLLTNYYTKTATDSAISSATSSLVSTTTLNNTLGNYTTTAALQTNYYTKTATDSAISAAVNTATTTWNGNLASAQTTLQTNINTVNNKVTSIGALYTTTVTVNGLVGGFGIYNNGTTIEAGFDVDTFWIGKTSANKVKPFIITGGVVYMSSAVIQDGTIGSAKIADTIQSTNYSSGIAGWRLTKAGTLELNGPRMQVTNSVISVKDTNGIERVRIGDL